jgi:hypothetical protein
VHTSLQRPEKLHDSCKFLRVQQAQIQPARDAGAYTANSMNTILRRNMSRFTIANLPRMEVAALSQELLALKSPDNSVAVIDVRDGGRFENGDPRGFALTTRR